LNHGTVGRRHGLIRGWTGTHATAHDGTPLAEFLDAAHTAGGVWSETAYRLAKDEAMLAARGLISRIHRKRPKGRSMPARTRRAKAARLAVRSKVEHVFSHQEGMMGAVVRTIGLAWARLKYGLVNPAYNMRRLLRLSSKATPA
jgi:IS5 family transposase